MWVKGELFDDFATVRQFARESLDREQQINLFDRLDWFESLWTHCPPGKALLISRARSENCDAWLFLTRSTEKEASSLSNWYTLAFRPIFSGDANQEVRGGQLQAMAKRLSSGLSRIDFDVVPEWDGSLGLITDAFSKAGWIVRKTPSKGNWVTELGGRSFEEYWSERPGEVRSTYARKIKKFGVETRIFKDFNAESWAAYEAIYQKSWKGGEHSPAFLKEVAEREGKAGALRLGVAIHDGEPIAAQFWTLENGHAIIHKLAYDDSWAETSAGTILSHDLFRHVIDIDKVALIDYGTGDDRYKQSWMTERRQLYSVSLFNPKTLKGLTAAARHGLSGLVHRRPQG